MLRAKLRARLLGLAALALAGVLALAVAGCGSNSVPGGAVAKVGDTVITKAQFDHWLAAGAKQQAAPTGQTPTAVVIPDPPTYSNCVAAKAKQPVPKGVPKPKPSDLKTQCAQEYMGLRDQTLQFLISGQWLIQEAAREHVTASNQEVMTTFLQQKKQSFPKGDADYQKFLRTSGQTQQDLLYRV